MGDVTRNNISAMTRLNWGYYGYPGSENAAVGEVGYVVDWRADQMSRLEWDVTIDGSEQWSVEVPANPDAEAHTITTKQDDDEEDQTAASLQLLDLIDWDDTNIRAIDTNLFVAGQGDYANLGKGWRVVSTIENGRKQTLDNAVDVVDFINRHPANPKIPNPPLSKIIDLLEALEWLTRQSSTQSKQRVLMNGLLATADGFGGPNGEDFWTMWNESLSAKQDNPDDMSPVRVQGPHELVKDGINWILPPFGYDDVLDRKITAAIGRLGYGLPVPPEILFGMQAQSRATAFQVEENAYRAHIEPPAKLVAQVAQDALNVILPDVTVKVVPNPSKLLARRNSVEDVKWAREQGLVTPQYTREVLAIPDDAAPDENIDGVPIGSPSPLTPDPANVAADEPVTAAAHDGPDLSTLLADIDSHLASELAGVSVMATDRARQRLGAAARAFEKQRTKTEWKDLTNSQLASTLGMDGLTAAGVDVVAQIAEPIDSAANWWIRRIGEAWSQASTLIPGWVGQGDWVTESTDILDVSLAEHILSTLDEPVPPPLEAGNIRRVVDAAAGGH